MSTTPTVYKKIQALRERYYAAKTGQDSLLQMMSESEVSEQVYNSNAIENSTLSLEDTERILLQLDLDRFISEREMFEARNLARVVEYRNTVAKERELDMDTMLLLHKMLMTNIRDDIAGRFREGDEWVRVGSHIATAPEKIIPELEQLLTNYYAKNTLHIIKRIAHFHLQFESIHPFVDGNGRIGRVLNNYLLVREGYVPINIRFIDRTKYYEAFQEFDKNQTTKHMEEIVGRALTNSYHKRLAYLERREIITLSQYAKTEKLSHSNLLNKAKRQTIEAFFEKGVWKIGV